MNRNSFAVLFFISIISMSCTSKSSETPANSKTDNATTTVDAKLADKGKQVYQVQCTACHNPNPKLPGSLGPEVWGSSKELIQLRVIDGKYPTGYKPKRETKIMVPLPHLKNDIDALHAYLNQ